MGLNSVMSLGKVIAAYFRIEEKKEWYLAVAFSLVFCACGESKYKFEAFSNMDSNKKESDFYADSPSCHAERDRHSNKIEGRKFGFKGQDTGYLGCMQLKGWRFEDGF